MFIKKRELMDFYSLKASVIALEQRLNKHGHGELVECEKCNCLLNEWQAFRGKPEIKQKTEWVLDPWRGIKLEEKTDYISYSYYCGVHKPVEKKKKEK